MRRNDELTESAKNTQCFDAYVEIMQENSECRLDNNNNNNNDWNALESPREKTVMRVKIATFCWIELY